jgi:hypothetical protein
MQGVQSAPVRNKLADCRQHRWERRGVCVLTSVSCCVSQTQPAVGGERNERPESSMRRLRATTALLRTALLALPTMWAHNLLALPGYGNEYDHTDGLTEPGQLSGLQRTVDLQWWDPKLEDWKVRLRICRCLVQEWLLKLPLRV